MRLPLMTTRRWIVAVAVFALLFAASGLGRSLHYQRIANVHFGMYEQLYAPDMHDPRPWAIRMQRRATYHLGLYIKYREAARFPWLPVEPDPPEPK